jgi:hypothetical protein
LQVDTTGTVTPTASSTQQIDELKATVTAQDSTISTLQAQFANLRTNQEAHIESLTKTHNAEVTSLKEYTRVLEEQLAHRPLHHGKYLPIHLTLSSHLIRKRDCAGSTSHRQRHCCAASQIIAIDTNVRLLSFE